ncbi:hypothetical protein ACFVVM_07820 [Nocardia sp. NPDC058176]|uniref:hypothetical protein n=1 Tax=Nocardia sp. NPDC058176 TaxID=3346368 RepID=UPI0036DD3174
MTIDDHAESTDTPLAGPDTLLGMIQRGRGACRPAALAQPTIARELVVDCIVGDPRWDHQVESRGWLYANLVVDLGIDPIRFRPAYAGPLDPTGDSDAWLTLGVLGHLAARGTAGSIAELRHYLRSGRDLNIALDRLIPFVDHPEAQGLLDDILQVYDNDQLLDCVGFCSPAELALPPWPQWRRESARIDRTVRAAELVRAQHARLARDRGPSDRELVLRAAVAAKVVAAPSTLDLSAEQWETTLLTVATDYSYGADIGWTRREQIALRRCLRQLNSPSASEWARANVDLDSDLGYWALSILSSTATPADAPALLELLTEALARGNDHIVDQCTLVSALAPLEHVAAVPIIEEIFDTTVYSYLRRQCAEALSRLSTEFGAGRAVECLDDCESGTRAVAIACVDIGVPGVRQRLDHLAEDPSEDDDNRLAARARVGGIR